MVSESKYKELIEHAKAQCKRNKCNLDPLDLVHDALIECDNEEGYFKYIRGAAKKEHARSSIIVRYGSANATDYLPQVQDSERQCKKCGETKQLHLFYKDAMDKRDGTTIKCYICKDCRNIKQKKYRKSKKVKDRTVIERQKRYWQREKQKLSDKYIYHRVLRRRLKKEQITDEMVKEKREQLILKNK